MRGNRNTRKRETVNETGGTPNGTSLDTGGNTRGNWDISRNATAKHLSSISIHKMH